MRLTNIMIGLFLGMGLVSSCQSEIEEAQGYGYLQLSSVDVNKSVTTRADVTSSEAIAVDVLDESASVVKHADDWKELNDVLLPVATYTIKAYSADKDKEAQGFDAAPYYEGQTEVAIEANKAKAEIGAKKKAELAAAEAAKQAEEAAAAAPAEEAPATESAE